MNITVLCSDPSHPVNPYLKDWMNGARQGHCVQLVRRRAELTGGDLLFLISCSEIIKERERSEFQKSLVLHASDLPRGRGWSPHIWSIINGAEKITLSLLEAADPVDSGRIWHKMELVVQKHWLWDEINHELFSAELALMDFALKHFDSIEPQAQDPSVAATYFRKRTPADSEIDPTRSIAEQFDAIRVSDPTRFPAYFQLHGHKYKVTLQKMS